MLHGSHNIPKITQEVSGMALLADMSCDVWETSSQASSVDMDAIRLLPLDGN